MTAQIFRLGGVLTAVWLVALVPASLAGIAGPAEELQGGSSTSGIRLLYGVYRQCESSQDLFLCLKGRALRMLDRAVHADSIPLVDGVALVRRDEEGGRSLTENLEQLPNEVEPRRVDELLTGRIAAFMETHSLQFKMPAFIKEALDTNLEEGEGRGKKKKMLPAILMAMMVKGGMLALAMKALALLAGKALIISKLALVLAGVIALKKLFSGGGEKTTYEIVKQPVVSHSHQYSTSHEYADGGYEHGGGGSGGYGRSLDTAQSEAAQRLAYAKQLNQR